MEKTIQTGEISPRDYGILLRLPEQKKIFMSPLRYALGGLILCTPQEISELLKDKAQRTGQDEKELVRDFETAVRKREGSKKILKLGGRDVVCSVERYGRSYSGRVLSKGSASFYQVKLTNGSRCGQGLEYRTARCNCEDNSWSDVKYAEAICLHSAALDIALYLDQKSRMSIEDNITGLNPKDRMGAMSMPFSFFDKRVDGGRLLIDILFEYYVNKKSQFKVNQEFLDNPRIYTQPLIEALGTSWDKAQFGVLRQEEKESRKDLRLHGAIKALEKRVFQELWDRGFIKIGYSLEFKGTPYQVIGQRFIQKDSIYTFCTKRGMPPVIVKRNLGAKALDRFNSNDSRQDSPFHRVGEKYLSTDDATRRESLTEIIIPGIREDSITTIPDFLRRMYVKEMRS